MGNIYVGSKVILSKEELGGEVKDVNAAGGLVHNAKGQYLMIRRNDIWDLPKGHQEKGEEISQTALREVFEETGIELRSAHFHGVIHFRSDAWEDEDMYLYSSDDFETHNELALCDEGELAWINEKELFDLPMWEGDRLFLRQIAEGRDQISMTLSYEGDKLISASDSCS